ncbi:MAG: hypothetical protein IJ510_02370 [Selenomonadales bacterium]|nr:hypothetical protein [Selenomonadales bacterium]
METILLNFEGYWMDIYKDEVPHEAGVYCVYACESMAANKIAVLRELIYVGAADDVAACIADHEKLVEWKERLGEEETLCYSFANVNSDVRSRVEGAMVYHHRPPCNRIEEEVFPFDDTRLSIVGEHELLDDSFVVCAEK